jgi:lipid-A-disaccharide synthase
MEPSHSIYPRSSSQKEKAQAQAAERGITVRPDIFLFAGEPSGDLHGAELVRALLDLHPQWSVVGVGGPRMRAAGMRCVLPMEEFQVMGFIDVLCALPSLARSFFFVSSWILRHAPRIVVGIDYPGFNLRLASRLKKRGFAGKVCHYICPSVWAWGKRRIPHMARTLDLLLAILPFEPSLFAHTSLRAEYVGNPLVHALRKHCYRPLDLPGRSPVIGIFPGSRHKEIARNLPIQLRAARQLTEVYPECSLAVSVASPCHHGLIHAHLQEAGLTHIPCIPSERTYDLMSCLNLAIATSGTVTLELALHEVPTLVTYALTSLDLFLAQRLFRIHLPHYCLVNILAAQEVFPEFIGPRLHTEALFSAAKRLLASSETCKQLCCSLRKQLQEKDASREAAYAIASLPNFS